MVKRYLVRLSEPERTEWEALVKTGRAAARKRLHAQSLLKADEGAHGPAWTDTAIMKALDVSIRTMERLRQCLVEATVLKTSRAALFRGLPRGLSLEHRIQDRQQF